MRRGVWVVLVLMGGVPAGALAQQEQERPAGQARAPRQVSNEVLQQQISELWQGLQQLQGEVAQLRQQAGGRAQVPGVGGSGRVGTAPEEEPATVIIVDQSAQGQRSAGGAASQESQPGRSNTATGGSGMAPRSQAQAGAPAGEIFVGTVRSVEGGRLIMVDPSDRVFEFSLGARTRILGPEGHASSVQALEEGTLVRAVTQEGGDRTEVRSLRIIGPAQAP
jgi:hypothetical protein